MAEKILIVDDDLDTLRLVGLMLQRQGYQISAATNGQQGLDKAVEENPDLILLDVMMPDIDGYEVTRRLRQNPSTMETPILLFTAKAQMNDKVVGFEVGADDYLTKPTHPSELQARVKTLLSRVVEKKELTGNLGQDGGGFSIGILSARGGLGITTLSVNIAAGLYTRSKSDVVVVELLPGQGVLALELGLTPSSGMTQLLTVENTASLLSSSVVADSLVTHGSGLKILTSSDRPRDMNLINQVANYEAVVKRLARISKFAVYDFGVGIQPFASNLLPLCDEVLVVLEGVPNTIIRTKTLIDDIASMGVNKRNINVILNNRARSDTQLPASQVQNQLQHEILCTITPAPELLAQATRMQTPAYLCQPDSLMSRQINKLVEFISERQSLPR